MQYIATGKTPANAITGVSSCSLPLLQLVRESSSSSHVFAGQQANLVYVYRLLPFTPCKCSTILLAHLFEISFVHKMDLVRITCVSGRIDIVKLVPLLANRSKAIRTHRMARCTEIFSRQTTETIETTLPYAYRITRYVCHDVVPYGRRVLNHTKAIGKTLTI